MNPQDLYKEAVRFYQSGDLAKAEGLLRQILTSGHEHAPALHLMGIIALDLKNYEIAEGFVSAALNINNSNPNFYFTMGRILGRQKEKQPEAIEYYNAAISLQPDFKDALNNLGTMYLSLGKLDEASDIFKRLLEKDPNDFNASSNYASILFQKKKFQEAYEWYDRSLKLKPDSAQVSYDMGITLIMLGRTDDALLCLEDALAKNPAYIEPMVCVGNIYHERGELDKALSYYMRSNAISPNEEAYGGIVQVHIEKNNDHLAITQAEEAVRELPESAIAWNSLGHIYTKTGDFTLALECFEKSLALNAENPLVYSNIANTLKQQGQLDKAIEYLKKALQVSPDAAEIYSNLLLTMIYMENVSPEELSDTAQDFGKNIADKHLRTRPFQNDRNPDRKLRVGYISADFRNHSVSYFLSPIFLHDKNNFELYAYSKVQKEDEITQKIKQHFAHWRDIRYLSNEKASNLIEQDQIDILVDLSGHTAHNGLMVFARKPAPIQVTYVGYPATTGMKAIDYKITDSYIDPVGMTEHLYTEKLWRLPDIFTVYAPRKSSPDVIDHPPFEDNGYLTFGSFNNFSKVTDGVLTAWSRILRQLPNSKLLIEISGLNDEKVKAGVKERFANSGIREEQVVLKNYSTANQYVLYNHIDIALDPFPCVGGTTSMDTVWMGVPFVTLAGKDFASRMGVSILNNAGLPELVAQTVDEYVTIATALAKDPERLRTMRKNLRDSVASSPLMDQERFTRNMEQAFRDMWKIWATSA